MNFQRLDQLRQCSLGSATETNMISFYWFTNRKKMWIIRAKLSWSARLVTLKNWSKMQSCGVLTQWSAECLRRSSTSLMFTHKSIRKHMLIRGKIKTKVLWISGSQQMKVPSWWTLKMFHSLPPKAKRWWWDLQLRLRSDLTLGQHSGPTRWARAEPSQLSSLERHSRTCQQFRSAYQKSNLFRVNPRKSSARPRCTFFHIICQARSGWANGICFSLQEGMDTAT